MEVELQANVNAAQDVSELVPGSLEDWQRYMADCNNASFNTSEDTDLDEAFNTAENYLNNAHKHLKHKGK